MLEFKEENELPKGTKKYYKDSTLGIQSELVQLNSSGSHSTLGPQSLSSDPSGQFILPSQRTFLGKHAFNVLQGNSLLRSQTVQFTSSDPSVQSWIESQ